MADVAVTLRVNGRRYDGDRRAARCTLADFLRERCRLTGTHVGCEHGVCGACTVLVDGAAVRSCLLFAVQVQDAEITTVEGLDARATARCRPCSRRSGTATACSAGSARPASSYRSRRSSATSPTPTDDGDPRRAVRQPLPLHRLPGHRRRPCAGLPPRDVERRDSSRPAARRPASSASASPRREDPRLLTGQRPLRRRRHAPTTCSTSRSCAATSPAARSRRSTSTEARGARRRRRRAHRRRPQPARAGRLGRLQPDRPASSRSHRVLADGDVRFVGEPIVLVVATSRYVAEDACELVVVDIDPLPAVVDVDAGRSPTTRRSSTTSSTSNVAAAIRHRRRPGRRRRLRRRRPRRHRARTTSSATCACRWRPAAIVATLGRRTGRLDVRISTQGPHGVRSFLARALGIAENDVRVVMDDVGGGFGQKMFMLPDEVAVVLASRLVPGPLKWIEDRRENLVAGQHARDDRMTLSMAARRRRAHPRRCAADARRGRRRVPGRRQQLGHVRRRADHRARTTSRCAASRRRAVYTNTCGRCSYRGPWMMETFAREQLIDDAARELGIDPLELRRRNVIDADELPYTMPSGMQLDDVSIAETLEQAVEMIDYDAFRREQARGAGRRAARSASASGCTSSRRASPAARWPARRRRVSITTNGRVLVATSSASHGQSVETTAAQVVADELGVAVRRTSRSSRATRWRRRTGPGTGGSRSAVLCSGAVREAARTGAGEDRRHRRPPPGGGAGGPRHRRRDRRRRRLARRARCRSPTSPASPTPSRSRCRPAWRWGSRPTPATRRRRRSRGRTRATCARARSTPGPAPSR